RINHFTRCLLVLEISLEDRGSAYEHLAAVRDPDFDAWHRPSGGRRVGLGVRLERYEASGFCGAVDLLQVDADGPEEPEGVGSERRAAGQRPPGPAQAELVPDGSIDEELS